MYVFYVCLFERFSPNGDLILTAPQNKRWKKKEIVIFTEWVQFLHLWVEDSTHPFQVEVPWKIKQKENNLTISNVHSI